MAAQTQRSGYHDLPQATEDRFSQEAMSYLRVAYLFKQFGVSVPLYMKALRRIQPRLDKHLSGRGAYQREVFGRYYEGLNLKPPVPLLGRCEKA